MHPLLQELITGFRNFDLSDYIANLPTNDVFTGFLSLSLIGSAAFLGRWLIMFSWRLFKRKFVASITVHNTDQAFYWIATWLRDNGYNEKIRSSIGTTQNEPRRRYISNDSDEAHAPILLIPAVGTYLLFHKGTPFLLTKEQGEQRGLERPESFCITTLGRGRGLLDKLIREAQELAGKKSTVSVKVFEGHWYEAAEKIPRTLDSVIIPPKDKAAIVADMTWFLENQQWYIEKGVPYHRGYLFHGPPGTGKTSLAFALASHFNLNLCVLNLAAVSSDGALGEAFNSAPEGSIMLLEDIDRLEVVQTDAVSKEGIGKVTMSGILNALDGVAANEGRIIIMTTNRPELLDPALIRPGRIDVKKEIGLPREEEKISMYKRFFPTATQYEARLFVEEHHNGNMAEFQEALVRKTMEEK